MRTITQALLFGAPIEKIFDVPIPHPDAFHQHSVWSLSQLHSAASRLRNASALFARTMATKVFTKQVLTAEDYRTQSQLLESQEAWFRELQRAERAQARLSEDEVVWVSNLKVGYFSTYILVACASDIRQINFDQHLDKFKAINQHIRVVLKARGIAVSICKNSGLESITNASKLGNYRQFRLGVGK